MATIMLMFIVFTGGPVQVNLSKRDVERIKKSYRKKRKKPRIGGSEPQSQRTSTVLYSIYCLAPVNVRKRETFFGQMPILIYPGQNLKHLRTLVYRNKHLCTELSLEKILPREGTEIKQFYSINVLGLKFPQTVYPVHLLSLS